MKTRLLWALFVVLWLPVGLPGEAAAKITLEDGHLWAWNLDWTDPGIRARLWGREGGWTSGGVELGLVQLGPLSAKWGENEPWRWSLNASSKPGNWGAVLGHGLPLQVWLVQTPGAVRAGAQAVLSGELGSVSMGFDHTWGEGETARALVTSEWGPAGAQGRLQASLVQATWTWSGHLEAHYQATDLPGSLKLETHLDWPEEAETPAPEFDFQLRWAGLETSLAGALLLPAGWTGTLGWGAAAGGLSGRAVVERRVGGLWGGRLRAALGRQGYRIALEGNASIDLVEGEASLGLEWNEPGAGVWSALASLSHKAGETLPGAHLTAGWRQEGGPWALELDVRAPKLATEWFGPDNRTRLSVSTSW